MLNHPRGMKRHDVGEIEELHINESKGMSVPPLEFEASHQSHDMMATGTAWSARGAKGTTLGGSRGFMMFGAAEVKRNAQSEVMAQVKALNIKLSQEDEDVTLSEYWTYRMEKFMSGRKGALFLLLFVFFLFCVLILGIIWYSAQHLKEPFNWNRRLRGPGDSGDDDDEVVEAGEVAYTFAYSLFIAFQVILSAGLDDNIDGTLNIINYCTMILVGLIVLGLLIGMITEAFESLIATIREGELKAVEKEHTLVLGWSEGTVRLVCQLAFLRRQWQMMNEGWVRWIFWWTRTKPSTVVAKSTIVILSTKPKGEMEQLIEQGFAERGISRSRTRIGCDVVCRVGNPSDVQDLQRCGAHRAAAIVLQMAQEDSENDGVECGASIRTLMALRFVLCTSTTPPLWEHLRIVVEMNKKCEVMDAAAFAAPTHDRRVVFAQDCSLFLNSTLYACLGQPGLAQVQLELMSFEGAAVKFRRACEFPKQGAGLIGKTMEEACMLWEDAVLLGVQKSGKALRLHGREESGLLPEQTYRVQPNDVVIFLCESSMPQFAKADHAIGDDLMTIRPSRRRRESTSELNVLICGWKREWEDPIGFFDILEDIISNARQGMLLHFVCKHSKDEFCATMHAIMEPKVSHGKLAQITHDVQPGVPAWVLGGKIRICHTCGDAGVFHELKALVTQTHFHEAIVIPPTARERMDPLTEDTWVVSVILALRHISQQLKRPPVHVIAENALDATSKLAIVPSDLKGNPMVPDFVNAVAIRARALAQVLAYPEMAPVLQDLLTKDAGNSFLILVHADVFGVVDRTLTFREIKQVFNRLQPETGEALDVLLGIRPREGELLMAPKQSEPIAMQPGDKLIIITRKATSAETYETMIQATPRYNSLSTKVSVFPRSSAVVDMAETFVQPFS